MQCVKQLSQMGFACTQLQNNVIEVLTPLTHLDGEPVYFYIENDGRITDDGNLLFNLLKNEVDLSHRLHHIKARANQYGIEFINDEFIKQGGALHEMTGLYLEFIANFLEHEASAIKANEHEDTLVDEVIAILEKHTHGVKLKRHPVITGTSGQEHIFDLQAGRTPIDVLMPNSHATGAALRKASDIIRADSDINPLFILDDRCNPNKAEQEMQIISAVARVTTFSTLQQSDTPLKTLH